MPELHIYVIRAVTKAIFTTHEAKKDKETKRPTKERYLQKPTNAKQECTVMKRTINGWVMKMVHRGNMKAKRSSRKRYNRKIEQCSVNLYV